MGIILSIFQILLSIHIMLKEYKHRSISIFFWVICFILYSVPNFINNVFGCSYSSEVLIKSVLFVIGFQMFYLITKNILNKTSKDNPGSILNKTNLNEQIDDSGNNKLINKLFYCNLIVLIIILLYTFLKFGRFTNLSWGEFYRASINTDSIGDIFLKFVKVINDYLFFAFSGLLLITLYLKQKRKSIVIGFIILFYLFITRNRIIILPLFVSIILLFIIKYDKIQFKQILIILIMGIGCIYFIYAIWIFRHAGTLSNFLREYNFLTFNKEIITSIIDGEGELGLKNIFYYFVKIDNKFPDLGKGHTYIRLLLMFIPTKLCFGLKPKDFAITMSSAYTNNILNTTYSVHPTFYGDLFANFGYLGIFLGVLWAIIFSILDKKISNMKNIIIKSNTLVIWGTCLIILARGSVYNSMYLGIVSSIILVLVSNMTIRKTKNNK